MPFPMKIQPLDFSPSEEMALPRQPAVKSRLKRLFEFQFPSVLRNSGTEKVVETVVDDELPFRKDCSAELEPSSVCLAKMVQNFMEDSNEKQQSGVVNVRCNRNRSNCFNNRNRNDSSEDETDGFGFSDSNLTSSSEASEILKNLVPCGSLNERDILAHTARIMEKNKITKRKDDICRKIVTDGLLAVGYDASICKSHWEKSPSYPAGEYEYIDVIIDEERLLIDIDFKSEFEMARSTKTYKSILQMLPFIFVGKTHRLKKIIDIVSEAAKQSLKKKGMHVPPWRKSEYVNAKWLSPYNRATPSPTIGALKAIEFDSKAESKDQPFIELKSENKDQPFIELKSENKDSVEDDELSESIFAFSEEKEEWKPPGIKIVAGLASKIEDEARNF